MNPRPPLPPFTEESARAKVQAAEDAWNSRDPERVSLAYTEDTEWRNRAEFVNGRAAVVEFLRRKWARELDYRLKKTLWPSPGTASPCALSMSGTTTVASGTAATATRTGSLMNWGI